MKAVLAKALRGGVQDLLAAGGGARSVGGVRAGVRESACCPERALGLDPLAGNGQARFDVMKDLAVQQTIT